MTRRAVLIGLIAAAFISVFQVWSRVRPYDSPLPFASVHTLFTGTLLLLFLIAVWNRTAGRLRPGLALRPPEMAVAYGLSTVGAAIAGYDEVQFLVPCLLLPFRKTSETSLGSLRYLFPNWITPQSPGVVEPYYAGRASFWNPEIWRAWVVPLGAWMAYLAALGAVMWAWNVILRRRWVEHDKLAFPCLELPLQLCQNGGFGGMAGGRLFWAGFGFSTFVESVNQLRTLFPNVPGIASDHDLTPLLNNLPSPWKALSPMSITLQPFQFGICYLVPTDILFSGWFFYVLRKAGEVWGYAQGWRELGWDAKGFPYTRAQCAGAWAALFVLLLWSERKRLMDVLDAALSWGKRAPAAGENEEFASLRVAGRVLILGTVFLVWWSVQSGQTPILAILYYAFFWILTVTMTRVYAQVGPPMLELYYLDPQKTLTTIFGTLQQPPQSLAQFSLLYWINRDHRGQPMAHQLSAMYIAQNAGMDKGRDRRRYSVWILVAFVVGSLACLLAHLHFGYGYGQDTWKTGQSGEAGAWTVVGRLKDWIARPSGPNYLEAGFMAFGALFTFALARINTVFIGSPLHPIGYALAVCFGVEYNWLVFLLSWAAKSLILRFGGLTMYRRYLPAALGLTLGGFIAPVVWGLFLYWTGWYR